MTSQNTPLKTKANTIRKTIDCCDNWNMSLPCDVQCDREFVWRSDAEAEIQQLKDEHQKVMDNWKEYTNYQLRQKDGIIERLNETIHHQEDECIELEKQIETAKLNLDELLKQRGMTNPEARQMIITSVFEEKIPDNYNGDYDEYVERSSEEKT